MKIWNYPSSTPIRRDIVDPRSSSVSTAAPIRKILLNDRRSTR
jgi:hypothetical protein